MAGDWIKLYRKVVDSAAWSDSTVGWVWVNLLLRANWRRRQLRDGRWLSPGELIIGQDRFAAEIGTTRRKLRTALEVLTKCGNVTSQTTSHGTHLTIVNWRTYQNDDEANDQPNDQQATSDRPASDQQATREEEVKKGRREEDIPPTPHKLELPPILDSPDFRSALESWQAYKGRSYKPRGLKSLISQAAKRAEEFGLATVVNAFEVAMSNGWAGWNQDSSFRKGASNGHSDIGAGQLFDPEATQKDPDHGVW